MPYEIKVGDVLKDRRGWSIRIIAVDVAAAAKESTNIVGLALNPGGYEIPHLYTQAGELVTSTPDRSNLSLILPEEWVRKSDVIAMINGMKPDEMLSRAEGAGFDFAINEVKWSLAKLPSEHR